MIKWLRSKHGRTVFLALLATLVFVAAAIRSFDVEPQLLLALFVICVGALFIIILLALLASTLPLLIRKFLNRSNNHRD